MKFLLCVCLVVVWSKGIGTADGMNHDVPNGSNIFIITLDGYRWQELFNGADSSLIHNADYTKNISHNRTLYWHRDEKIRREKLMPFVWNVIANEGQLFGNRKLGSKVNTKNFYALSYPGYNEIFTGDADPFILSNKKISNKNQNLLEHLNKIPTYKGRVAAFTSWDVFPFILAEQRSKIYVNSGFERTSKKNSYASHSSLTGVNNIAEHNESERKDLETFSIAKEYILKNHPKVMFIGLGGTDSYGHQKKYDQYLNEAHNADKIIEELWHITQGNPFYRGNTTFIITTDHGRGDGEDNWYKHGAFVSGSSQTWIMMLGNGIKPIGEAVGKGQSYQRHIAGTVGHLVGVKTFSRHTLPFTYFSKSLHTATALR